MVVRETALFRGRGRRKERKKGKKMLGVVRYCRNGGRKLEVVIFINAKECSFYSADSGYRAHTTGHYLLRIALALPQSEQAQAKSGDHSAAGAERLAYRFGS